MIIDQCGYLLGVRNRSDWNAPLLLVAVSILTYIKIFSQEDFALKSKL